MSSSTTDLIIAYSINPIYEYNFICLGPYLSKSELIFGFDVSNCFWIVSITLILHRSAKNIVQCHQIPGPWRLISIIIFTDYSIFENWTHNIDCDMCCITRSAVLLKPNGVHVFWNNYSKKLISQHCTVTETWVVDITKRKSEPNSDSLSIFWPFYGNMCISENMIFFLVKIIILCLRRQFRLSSIELYMTP